MGVERFVDVSWAKAIDKPEPKAKGQHHKKRKYEVIYMGQVYSSLAHDKYG